MFRTINSDTYVLALHPLQTSKKDPKMLTWIIKCWESPVNTTKSSLHTNSITNILPSKNCAHDVGVFTSPDLTWSMHIDHQCKQAMQDTYEDLFVAHFTCLWFARSCAWLPNLGTTDYQQNSTGGTATKDGQLNLCLIKLRFLCAATYEERISQLNIIPLSYWHGYLHMTFFFPRNNLNLQYFTLNSQQENHHLVQLTYPL